MTNPPHKFRRYQASLPDEIDLRPGMKLRVVRLYDDAWGTAEVINGPEHHGIGKQGAFPIVSCEVEPRLCFRHKEGSSLILFSILSCLVNRSAFRKDHLSVVQLRTVRILTDLICDQLQPSIFSCLVLYESFSLGITHDVVP